MDKHTLINLIENEMGQQVLKWGNQSHFDHVWLSIFVEEVGEVSKALNEGQIDEMEKELVQCAALIFSWLMDNKREDK